MGLMGGKVKQLKSNSMNKSSNYKESLWWSFNAIVTGSFADIHNP